MTGYLIQLERRARLISEAMPWRTAFYAGGQPIPDVVAMRGRLKTENQGQTNSCVGHAGSTALESLDLVATGDKTQLSRWFAYITAQEQDNLAGRDQGATIYGMVKAAKKHGICTEDLCPFTGRYYHRLPKAAFEDAKKTRIRSHRHCTNYEDVVNHIGSGQGPVICGYRWPSTFANPSADGIVGRWSASGGGHATVATGYDRRRRLIECFNSHGERYGLRGWFYVPETEWNRLASHNSTSLFGVSDLTVFVHRPIDFSQGFNT